MNQVLSSRNGQDIIPIIPESTFKRIWTFAGGKGGAGMTANIGVALATMGYRIIVVDADLGGANLHTILNIRRPRHTLSDFLNRTVDNLNDILLDTPSENLRLISGGSDMVGLANIPYQSKLRLQRHLELLEADYILIDLGAGTSFNTLDFFIMSSEGFIITNPEPIAKINAYTFLKSAVYRLLEREFKRGTHINEIIANEGRNNRNGGLSIPELVNRIGTIDHVSARRAAALLGQFRPRLIMNRLRRLSQEKEGVQLAGLAGKYLGVSTDYLGMVREDPHVIDASECMMPVVLHYPACGASKDIYTLVGRLGVEDRLKRFETSKSVKLKKFIKTEQQYWRQ